MVTVRSGSLSSLRLLATRIVTTITAYRKPPLDGGSVDPDRNVALFNAVKKARADGVPKANIESALQKVRACVGCGDAGARSPPCYSIRSFFFPSLLRQRAGRMELDS